MDVGPVLIFGAVWMVVNAIRRVGGGPAGGKQAPLARDSRVRPPVLVPGASRTVPPPGADPTQREGARLQDLLRDLGRSLEQASGPLGRTPDHRLPSAEEVEEVESVEGTPRVQTLETAPVRTERSMLDQDDQAELVVAERLKSAQARSTPRTRANHQVFDARIRQEAADKTATRVYAIQQLRDAVIWREILGPPLSLREHEER